MTVSAEAPQKPSLVVGSSAPPRPAPQKCADRAVVCAEPKSPFATEDWATCNRASSKRVPGSAGADDGKARDRRCCT